MDTRTGRIVPQEDVLRMLAEERAHFVPVPAKMTRQARRLMERGENADLDTGAFAGMARAHRKRMAKRNAKKLTAKASRRRNRGR